MGVSFKSVALLLIAVLAASSLLMVEFVSAQSAPVPSVPEFTIRYVKSSYNITSTSKGETVSVQIDNSTVELVIKNQALNYPTGNVTYLLYYNVQAKSHFTQDWTELYPIVKLKSDVWAGTKWYVSNNDVIKPSLSATNAEYTILSLPAKIYPINTDLQVKALIGHSSYYLIQTKPFNQYDFSTYPVNESAIALDASSGWSRTQTVTLPKPSPTPTLAIPTIKGVPDDAPFRNILFIVAILVVLSIILAVILFGIRRLKVKQHSN